MASLPSSDDRTATRTFAGLAQIFAKQVSRMAALPGFPWLWIGAGVAALLMAIVGAFGTGALPPLVRLPFWGGLIGWNALKWQLWFALAVRRPADWTRAALAGTLLVNLPLPLEIEAALDLAGVAAAPARMGQWAQALAISALVFVAAGVTARTMRGRAKALAPKLAPATEVPDRAMKPQAHATSDRPIPLPAPDPEPAPSPADALPDLLRRAGIAEAASLRAIEAEDHYCRFHLADGRAPLLHCRFRDALAAVAALDGAQIHRGLWLASAMVTAARREERRWRLGLADGRSVAVSASHVGAVRARGWLERPPAGP